MPDIFAILSFIHIWSVTLLVNWKLIFWLWDHRSWTNLGIWLAINAAPTWWSAFSMRHFKKVDPETAKRYSAFQRTDLHLLNFSCIAAIPLNFWIVPRVFIIWYVVFTNAIFLMILMIGTESGKPIANWRT